MEILSPKLRSTGRQFFDPFLGQNEENEIETYEEFLEKIEGKDPLSIDMTGWNFQAVDFSAMDPEVWKKYNFKGASFWGCTFPKGVMVSVLRSDGLMIWENFDGLPFKTFRGFMYTQRELMENDAAIYQHYLTNKKLQTKIAQTVHDNSISDALSDYLEGKTPVGVMGGHRLSRSSKEYRDLVFLCRKLAVSGFLIVTGGGPGAMEAANLGAYLASRTDEEVEEALGMIGKRTPNTLGEEYLDVEAADNVLKRFGMPTHMPSLGIPTFRYGHEPSNRFATWHAKFFSNAIREDFLLGICTGGILFTRGGPGTRQEIFQAACHNHYTSEDFIRPLVFIGKSYWLESGVYPLLHETSKGAPFHELLLVTDDFEEIVTHLVKHAENYKLSLHKNLEEYKLKFWEI
jgi:predicted Rossmann-fold nucleotide-binding protein